MPSLIQSNMAVKWFVRFRNINIPSSHYPIPPSLGSYLDGKFISWERRRGRSRGRLWKIKPFIKIHPQTDDDQKDTQHDAQVNAEGVRRRAFKYALPEFRVSN